jgi:hydrogenase maturation protease
VNPRPRVRVIGCGNADSGDDAAGLIAVAKARPLLAGTPGVEVVEAGPGLRVLELMDDAGGVVLVDAVRTRAGARPPGAIVHVAAGAPFPTVLSGALSSHGFGLSETVGLAAALGKAPPLVFLGVEVAHVAAGQPLSAAVAGVIPELVRRIVEETQAFLTAREA